MCCANRKHSTDSLSLKEWKHCVLYGRNHNAPDSTALHPGYTD